VWLDLPSQYRRLHQPFHVEKVKRYTPSVVEWGRQQDDRPLPQLVDGQQEWEVELILGKKEAEELVEIQPEVGGDGDPHPIPTTVEEVKEEVGPVRRSARLAVKVGPGDVVQGRRASALPRKPRRVRRMVTRYLVKWKGYGEEESTWEREDSLRLHAQDAIDEYEYRQTIDRGEDVVGVHYLHTLGEEEGVVTLHTVVISGGQ
jgi:hypothetical protein